MRVRVAELVEPVSRCIPFYLRVMTTVDPGPATRWTGC